MHCFSFDIETIPDVDFGRRYMDLDGLSDEDVATAMMFKRHQATGSDFLPLHQHRVVAISVTFRTADTFRVWTESVVVIPRAGSFTAAQLSPMPPVGMRFSPWPG